jgi:hypothetical protein|tara:strand:- start:19482 stop:20036 length:555 start_codon:yes stop_codon:yes gene_type:complete
MKLFEMDRKFNLIVSEEAWGLSVFKDLLKRDKSKDKEIAMKEMLFVWFWCDIKSQFLLLEDDIKQADILKDVSLPAKWKPDEKVWAAIDYYTGRKSVIEQLYIDALISAKAIGAYLRNTAALLAERDMQGKVVTDIAKITASNQKVPILMANLKKAEKEVIKEKEDNEGKKKGSKTFNTFENGL